MQPATWRARMAGLIKKRVELAYLGQKRVQVSLIVAIPLTICVLVVGYGILSLSVIQLLIGSSAITPDVTQLQRALALLKFHLIGGMVISALIGVLLAYAIVLPLRKLTVSTQRISTGDLTQCINVPPDDELGVLGAAFDEMTRAINRQMLETISGGVLGLNRQQRIVTLNSAAEALFGLDADHLIGEPMTSVMPLIEENMRFYELVAEALRGTPQPSQTIHVTLRDGRRQLLVFNTALLHNQQDTLLGIMLNFSEADRQQQELRQLARAERLASLGKLAAALAHEIRNPLGSVRGFTQLLGEELPPHDARRAQVDVMIKEIDRLNRLIEQLLALAHPEGEQLQMRSVNPHELVDQVLVLANYGSLSQHVQIVRQYDAQFSQLQADGERLQQAFLNIILNAFHAMPNGGTLTISTRWVGERRQGRIAFSDTGVGISAQQIQRIFEPFYTTKADGTGLGLFIAQQIVQAHRGRLEVDSLVDHGTTFTMTLPVGS